MAFPTYWSVGSNSAGDAVTSLEFSAPPSVETGDTLIIFVGSDDNGAGDQFSTSASGWVKEGESGDAAVDCHFAIFSKEATGPNDDSTVIINAVDSNQMAGYYYCVKGGDYTSIKTKFGVDGNSPWTLTGYAVSSGSWLALGGMAMDGGDIGTPSASGIWALEGVEYSDTSGNDTCVSIFQQNAGTSVTDLIITTGNNSDGGALGIIAINSMAEVPTDANSDGSSECLGVSGAIKGSVAESAGVTDCGDGSGGSSTDTYYADASVAGPTDLQSVWNNDANAFNGSLVSSASTTDDGSTANNALSCIGTNATDLGDEIIEVKMRFYGSASSGTIPVLHVVIKDGAFSLGSAIISSSTNGWSNTTILDAPIGGWTWAKLNALTSYYYGDNSSGLSIYSVRKIEFIVTHSSGGGGVETYYADASDLLSDSGPWLFDSNAFDGDFAISSAQTTANGTLTGDGTTAPISGATITSVEYSYTYEHTMDVGDLSKFYIYSGGEKVAQSNKSGTSLGREKLPWASVSTPSGGWTWQKVNDLRFQKDLILDGA